MEFRRTPLSEVVEVLNRYASSSTPRLVIVDPSIESTRVSGVFRPDNVDALSVVLEAGFNIKTERSDDRLLLRGAPGNSVPPN